VIINMRSEWEVTIDMMMNTEACEVFDFWWGVNDRYLEFEEE
jgi:hypothetical protein